MSAVADIRGLKRICASCGVNFYDLNKRPIACPSCGEEFTGEFKTKSRRGRVAAATEKEEAKGQVEEKTAAEDEDEDDEEEEDDGVEIVSLDDDATVSDPAATGAGDEDVSKPNLDALNDDDDDLDVGDDDLSLDDVAEAEAEDEDEDDA